MRQKRKFSSEALSAALAKARAADRLRGGGVKNPDTPTTGAIPPSAIAPETDGTLAKLLEIMSEDSLRRPGTLAVVLRWGDTRARMAYLKRLGVTQGDRDSIRRSLEPILAQLVSDCVLWDGIILPFVQMYAREKKREKGPGEDPPAGPGLRQSTLLDGWGRAELPS